LKNIQLIFIKKIEIFEFWFCLFLCFKWSKCL